MADKDEPGGVVEIQLSRRGGYVGSFLHTREYYRSIGTTISIPIPDGTILVSIRPYAEGRSS